MFPCCPFGIALGAFLYGSRLGSSQLVRICCMLNKPPPVRVKPKPKPTPKPGVIIAEEDGEEGSEYADKGDDDAGYTSPPLEVNVWRVLYWVPPL